MGTRESADFYEAFKRHRESEMAKRQTAQEEDSEYQEVEEEFTPPSEPTVDSSEVGSSEYELDVGSRADSHVDDTVSSIHVEAPGMQGPRLSPDVYPDGPRTVSMRAGTLASGLAVVCAGFLAFYILGRVHGSGGSADLDRLLTPPDESRALSVTRDEGPLLPTAHTPPGTGAIERDRARPTGKRWILVLSTYTLRTENTARITLENLQAQGYQGLALAKDSKFIYLYFGPCPSQDDARLASYKAIFSGQKDFKDCFVKSVVMK